MDILAKTNPSATSRHPSHQRRVSTGFVGDSFSFFRSDQSTITTSSSSSQRNPSRLPMFDPDANPASSRSLSANNPDLDLNTVLGGLDLDYSTPRRLLSNNSNSSLLNNLAPHQPSSANPDASAAYSKQNRLSFSLLDPSNPASSPDDDDSPKFQSIARPSGYHQHSWSLASFPNPADLTAFQNPPATNSMQDLVLDAAASSSTTPNISLANNSFDQAVKSRFIHSASRSVSNPLFSALENPSGDSLVNQRSSGSLTPYNNPPNQYPRLNYNVQPKTLSDRNYPLNELDPNLLPSNAKMPSNNPPLPAPLWQKHLKNRLVDGNYEHKRSWSIASYSTMGNLPNDPTKPTIVSPVPETSIDSSRENSISSVEELAVVNEISSPRNDGFYNVYTYPPNNANPYPNGNANGNANTNGNANSRTAYSQKFRNNFANNPMYAIQNPLNNYNNVPTATPPPTNYIPNLNQYRNHPIDQYGMQLNGYNGNSQYNAQVVSNFNGARRGFNNNYNNTNNYNNAPSNSNTSNPNTTTNNNANRKRSDDGARFVNSTINDFKGQIYSLCKDQHGCRFLQRQLDLNDTHKNNENKENKLSDGAATTNSKTKGENYVATMIFNEINNHIVELMTDQFGNYLIQKLLDQVTVKQRIALIKNSCHSFIKISLDSHGTRALQKLIEVITTQEENSIIIKSFENDIVSLSRDLNGNHVVQKILTKFNYKSENIQFIFNAACKNCIKISTHRHGCCVLQRCLDYGSVEQCKQLSMVIAKNCLNLAVDPFGNYVVQYVLSKGEEESIKIIVDSILSKILFLSTHKFGSNVIEKILRINNLSHTVINEILKSSSSNPVVSANTPANTNNSTYPVGSVPSVLPSLIGSPSPNVFLSKLLHDPYGNYVLQTVLDVADKPAQFNQLADLIKPILPSVRNTAHGRRIAAKLQATQLAQQN